MSEHEQVAAVLLAKNQTPIELNASCTALVVVDMQRYFTEPSFPYTDAFEKVSPGICSGYLRRVRETVIPSIQRLLDLFRQHDCTIVFTTVGSNTNDGSDLPSWLRSLDQLALSTVGSRMWPPVGDPSWEIDRALTPGPSDIVLSKFSAGAFTKTNLEQELRNRGIENLVITGVATDVCVSTTAREAADRDFRVVVVSDACTTVSEQLHHANLETLQVFGWVRSATQITVKPRQAQAVS